MKNQTYALQAIRVCYRGATNHRSARMHASALAGRASYPYEDGLDMFENAQRAAQAYAKAKGWKNPLVGGQLPNGDFAFVMVPK